MRVSVVICTVNRAPSLETTLDALRRQTYADFEVVVVAGPSEDATDALLEARANELRVVQNDAVHLSRSRNLGLDAAAGELVAFLDDDAVPEPRWLERIAGAFEPGVTGAGGFVRGRNGTAYQYRYSLCSRLGHATTHADEPGPNHSRPSADPFLYLQGTNACFRREALRAANGFDEEIEFFHDETDLCARLVDAGAELRVVPGADVIHRFEPSHLRDVHGQLTDPYAVVKNHAYFVGRHAPAADAQALEQFAGMWRAQAADLHRRGLIDDERLAWLHARVGEGLAAGTRASAGERRTRSIAPPDPGAFRPFPRVPSRDGLRRAVFVSSEYPPGDFGGIGRFTQDLATGLAARGWEAHAVVPGAEPRKDPPLVDDPTGGAAARRMTSVEYEHGVWIHRVPPVSLVPRLAGSPVREPLERAALAHRAVGELEARFGRADIVSAPLWNADGLVLSLDPARPTVTTLMTLLKTVVEMHPSWPPTDVGRLLRLESEALRHSRELHAISAAILEGVRAEYPRETAGTDARVLHLGIQDRRSAHQRRRRDSDGPVRILFVGRLERRKGVDVLLEAAAELLRRHPDAELVLAGKDTTNTELGGTYREAFQLSHAGDPALIDRVRFAGVVTEDELYGLYADADIFTAPSRYESFGLVHVEAMMMGLPVVACDAGGMREVVVHGSTGLLAPPGDAAALEAALETLVVDATRRRAYGEAGRRRYDVAFTLERAAERTASVYAEIADAHREAVARPGDLERFVGETIERAAGVAANVAWEMARDLLDPAVAEPLAVVRRAWQSPDEAFVDDLYRGLLGREPDEGGRAAFIAQLREGRPRGAVVRELGWSEEALASGRPTDWLGDMFELPGWSEELACEVAFRQPSDQRFMQDIVDLLVAHPAARAAARERVRATLPSGRLAVARDLLASGIPLRSAPDFAGWEPMLGHLGQRAQAPPPTGTSRSGRVAATLRPRTRRLRQRAGRIRRLPRRVRRALRAIDDVDLRSAEAADALGRLEAQLRDAERRQVDAGEELARVAALISQGHATAGRAKEEFWHVVQEIAARLATYEGNVHSRAEWVNTRLVGVEGELHVNGQRTDILQRKLEAMAVDLRDRLPVLPAAADLPEPHIADRHAFEARLAAMGDGLRVNLGAGEKPLDDYVNVDMRALEDIEVVADVRRLPFEQGSLAEIASFHLVEHFRENELRLTVLPYWRSLLREDGVLRIVCPNWEAMAVRLAEGRMSWPEFRLLTFGLQDYDGDDHFAMYTPESLSQVLSESGFPDVRVLEEERMNGLCPEMELVAQSPVAAPSAGESQEAG